MTRAERFEGVVLVLIVLLVGTAAGAASFTHVHDWTMSNSPAGTPGWFGWANACISELVPIASLLELRRRRRRDREAKVSYPLALLIAAALLSLSAQLAVAKPGFSGWLLSAVPALAFMALVKLVLAGKPTPRTEVPEAPRSVADLPSIPQHLITRPPAETEPALPAEYERVFAEAVAKLWADVGLPDDLQREARSVSSAEALRPAHQDAKAAFAAEATARPAPAARPSRRRQPADLRPAIDALLAAEPGLSQQKIADRLGVTRWQVRAALDSNPPA